MSAVRNVTHVSTVGFRYLNPVALPVAISKSGPNCAFTTAARSSGTFGRADASGGGVYAGGCPKSDLIFPSSNIAAEYPSGSLLLGIFCLVADAAGEEDAFCAVAF